MSHPLVSQILQLAEAIAPSIGLEVVNVALLTHKNPAVLRVDIFNPAQHTGLEDCERMSQALSAALDLEEIIPHAYVLEVSSPGTDRQLESDREFVAFKGFTIKINTSSPFEGKQDWTGNLVSRDQTTLTISQKGKLVALPRELVTRVELV
jgi:ribosome maturation factor RimP